MSISPNQCENDSQTVELDTLLNEAFRGRVVRKDLTKTLKEGENYTGIANLAT